MVVNVDSDILSERIISGNNTSIDLGNEKTDTITLEEEISFNEPIILSPKVKIPSLKSIAKDINEKRNINLSITKDMVHNKDVGLKDNQNVTSVEKEILCSLCKVAINGVNLKEHIDNTHVSSSKENKLNNLLTKDISFNFDDNNVNIEGNNYKENLVICGVCAKSFDTKFQCINHMNKHDDIILNSEAVPIFPCDECNNTYIDISELKYHKINVHNTSYRNHINNEGMNSKLEDLLIY